MPKLYDVDVYLPRQKGRRSADVCQYAILAESPEHAEALAREDATDSSCDVERVTVTERECALVYMGTRRVVA